MRKIFLLIAKVGAGKGTQAWRLVAYLKRLGYVPIHVSSGAIFRYHISKNTLLGQQARPYYTRNILVPDSITMPMVIEYLAQLPTNAFIILDGVPRSKNQLRLLLKALPELNAELIGGLVFDVADKVSFARTNGRVLCKNEHIYHTKFDPPKVSGKCSKCGEPLKARKEDTKAGIARRLYAHRMKTVPMIEKIPGIVVRMDASGRKNDITIRMRKLVKAVL